MFVRVLKFGPRIFKMRHKQTEAATARMARPAHEQNKSYAPFPSIFFAHCPDVILCSVLAPFPSTRQQHRRIHGRDGLDGQRYCGPVKMGRRFVSIIQRYGPPLSVAAPALRNRYSPWPPVRCALCLDYATLIWRRVAPKKFGAKQRGRRFSQPSLPMQADDVRADASQHPRSVLFHRWRTRQRCKALLPRVDLSTHHLFWT